MQFNVISYTLFLFFMVIFFSSLAFAPWTTVNPPESPLDGSLRTCAEWLIYHGFTMRDFQENRRRSLDRNYKLDKNASTWAAIYAFKIGGEEPPPKLLPKDFCESFGEENSFKHPYTALKSEIKTCDGWISLYRISDDDSTYNIDYATNQDEEKMKEISIWTYSYFTHLRKWGKRYALSPPEYCTSIGKKVGRGAKFMSFMNFNGPHLTCAAWIYLYEYIDDLPFNYDKVLFRELQYSNYKTLIHEIPDKYRIHLRDQGLNGPNMIPMDYCIFMGYDESVLFPFKLPQVNNGTD